MHPLLLVILCLLVTALSWCLTIWIERKAKRLGLVQHPNHRSSHVVPTPSGGGVAIAVSALLAGGVLCLWASVTLLPIITAVALIAMLGFVDDLRDLPAAFRFPMQALIIASLIWTIWPLPAVPLVLGMTLSGWLLAGLILFAGLWWLNLFNFMDGIDGLAGSQSVLILFGACLIWWSEQLNAPDVPALWLACVTIAAVLGFLLRNWPPARIFMGDAGSNALALIIFAIAMLTIAANNLNYQAWLILPCIFVTDATVTLLRRIARGERPWQAHRCHAYQQLARRWGHRRVTLLYGALTLFWALPLALWAQFSGAWTLVPLAYAPLIGLAAWAGAGAEAERSA